MMFAAKYTGMSLIIILYRGKLCRKKVGNFFSATKIFPDKRFYPTNTREFKKSEEKMISNSLCNRGLLDIKMIYLEILQLETRIHCFNVNIILIDGKKWKNFKQKKTFIEGERRSFFRNFMIRIIIKFSKNISWVSFFFLFHTNVVKHEKKGQ